MMPPPGGSLQRSPSSGSKQVSRTTAERASPKAGEDHQKPTVALRSGSSRRGAMTSMPPVGEPAEPDVPPNVRLLAGTERNDKKIARRGRGGSGKDAEWKRGIVEQVFQSCSAIANLNCNLDQPTPLSNDGAAMVRKQLELGCTWVNTLWLEKNEIGPAGAEELAQGLRVHEHITDLSLADNPMRTAGFDHICNALALGKCPIFTLNIRNTGVIRIPGTLQDATYLKEIVSEDNPILFPPREVMHRGCARIIGLLSEDGVEVCTQIVTVFSFRIPEGSSNSGVSPQSRDGAGRREKIARKARVLQAWRRYRRAQYVEDATHRT